MRVVKSSRPWKFVGRRVTACEMKDQVARAREKEKDQSSLICAAIEKTERTRTFLIDRRFEQHRAHTDR